MKILYSEILKGEKNPNYKGNPPKECKICKANFHTYNSTQIYCSNKCVGIGNRLGDWRPPKPQLNLFYVRTRTKRPCNRCGRIIYDEKKGRELCSICRELKQSKEVFRELVCIGCNTTYSEYKSKKLSHRNFCSSGCYFANLRGTANPNYIDGRKLLTFRIRDSIKNKSLRKQVFTRDNYECKICGKRGGTLAMDHIKKFSLIYDEFISLHKFESEQTDLYEKALDFLPFFDLNNLQTLCRSCNWNKELQYRKEFKTFTDFSSPSLAPAALKLTQER